MTKANIESMKMKFLNTNTLKYAILLSIGWGGLAEIQSTNHTGAIAVSVAIVTLPITYFIVRRFEKKAELAIKKLEADRLAVKENIGKDGFTELMASSVCGNEEEIKEHVKNGADVDKVDKKGYTALMYAASNGKVNSVSCLLNLGADKNISTKKGNTAMYFADKNEHWEVKKLLK